MEILLNGKIEAVQSKSVITDILKSKKLSPETVIVEINSKIISKKSFESFVINPNDKIEILRFVGGG